MMESIFLLGAEIDLQQAFDYYEDLQEGRGDHLLGQLKLALGIVQRHPLIAPAYHGCYRRMLVRDFPLGIFYVVEPKRIIVAALLDLRQDPRSIRKRLH